MQRPEFIGGIAGAAWAVLSVQSTSAADLPVTAPAYVPAAQVLFSWTGFYLGGHTGGASASSTTTDVNTIGIFPAGYIESTINYSGYLGGIYAGANYQIGRFVVGADADYSWADLTGTGSDVSPLTGGQTNHSDKINWITTVTGRFGYAIGNWLVFVRGGAAWAGFSESSATFSPAGINTFNAVGSGTRVGWTVGTGVEWAFVPQLSLKLEYDFVDFLTADWNEIATSTATGAVATPARSARSDLNTLKAGVAYRF